MVFRHTGTQYADMAVGWPRHVARMWLEHQYMYTYKEVMEALAIANLKKVRYQFVYAFAGDTYPAYVRCCQGGAAFDPCS